MGPGRLTYNFNINSNKDFDSSLNSNNQSELFDSLASAGVSSEDLVNMVDQFLCEALQNPRERLFALRIQIFTFVRLKR
ncbi:hypothetical protein RND71_028464 [Anisodus tanguticus]|uniref:Uncharacterized protein n=1 Tax=Anisodus tanguticus TaxID=243964 RepID=A0AAE1V748_9SOLA|nr:hypothetical protein RND71_028464 [Anisodus tanguticus]